MRPSLPRLLFRAELLPVLAKRCCEASSKGPALITSSCTLIAASCWASFLLSSLSPSPHCPARLLQSVLRGSACVRSPLYCASPKPVHEQGGDRCKPRKTSSHPCCPSPKPVHEQGGDRCKPRPSSLRCVWTRMQRRETSCCVKECRKLCGDARR